MNSGTALLARSLRLQARSAAPHAARVALAVLLCLMLVSSSDSWSRGGAAGRYVLMQVAWCLALVGTFAGISLFAGAVAEEKEEGNLALLRMAGLGRTGLLLGVGLARLWDMLLLAACALPTAVLAVTLGGVALDQVLAVFAALGAWFCCLAGLGLLASTIAATAARAGSLLVAALLMLHLAPVFVAMVADSLGWDGLEGVLKDWLDLTIWARLGALSFSGTGSWWHPQIAVDLGLGLGGMVLAWLLFPRFAREGQGAGGEVVGTARRRLPIGRPRPGLAAIAWKDFHVDLGGWRLFIVKTVFAIVLAMILASKFESGSGEVGNAWMISALIWLVVETGLHLSRQWAGEIRGKTAELLLVLPASRQAVAYAKLLALPLALAPALLLFAVGFLLSPGGFITGTVEMLSEVGGWYGIVLVLFWWHSCAYLSLRWPRFALAGSLILLFGTQICLGFITVVFHGAGSLVVMMIVLAVAAAFMHASIARMWAARV